MQKLGFDFYEEENVKLKQTDFKAVKTSFFILFAWVCAN